MAILAISVAIFAILAPRPRQINLFNGSFWSLGYVDSFDIWTKAGTLKAIQAEVKGGRDQVWPKTFAETTKEPLNLRLLSLSWPNLAWTSTYPRCTWPYPKTRPQPQSSLHGGHFVFHAWLYRNGPAEAVWRLRPDFSLWCNTPR